MRYQIQKYNLSDHSDREVLVQKDGLMNETDFQNWANAETAKLQPVDGYGFCPVLENHHWFIQDSPQTSVATSTVDTSVKSSNTTSTEAAPADFATVARFELEQAKKQREAKAKAELQSKPQSP